MKQLDVTIKLRYTADQGGSAFANAVKGVLRPYNATSFFDLAYNFTDQWNEYLLSDNKDLTLTFTPEMFPNMTSSKILGMFLKYEYTGNTTSTFVLNDDLELKNNSYIDVSTISISKGGTDIKLTAKGEKTGIKNVEMVVVYKAKV
jgi:hypothetical protein